jgi:hypothetical protein
MYPPSERVWFELNGKIRHGTIIAYARDPKDYKVRVDGSGEVVEIYVAQIKGASEEASVTPEVMVA